MRRLAAALLAVSLAVNAVGQAKYFQRDGLVLKDKVYAELVTVSDCDFVSVVNCTFKKGLRLIGCDFADIESSRFLGGDASGGLYVGPGHPWTFADTAARWGYERKDGQQFQPGENLAGFIGQLGQSRNRLVGRAGRLVTFDLSGLVKSHWLNDWGSQVWAVNGVPARFVAIDGDDKAATLTFPVGSRVVLETDQAEPVDFMTWRPEYMVKGLSVGACFFRNPNGSGLSVYWSRGTRIVESTAVDCLDYGIGLEFADSSEVVNCVGTGNQVVPGWPTGYNQFEVVGWAAGVVFSGNVGRIGLVPKGNRQDVRVAT